MEVAKVRRSSQWLIWIPRVWLAVVGILLLWLSLTYRGISAFAAEWEFNAFGIYHPALTYLILVLVLCSPLLLLRWVQKRRRGQNETVAPEARLSRLISTTSRFLKTLYGAVAAAVVAAVVIASIGLFLPSATGPMVKAVVSDEAPPPQPGPVQLTGRLLYDRIAVFNEDFLFAKRSNRFAPMVGERADPTVLHYFVELPPELAATAPNAVTVRTGILRKGGLPGELVRLYRYAGFRVDPDYYVLFASEESMRRPYFTDALELLTLAIFITLVSGIYTYRHRRLRGLNTPADGENISP